MYDLNILFESERHIINTNELYEFQQRFQQFVIHTCIYSNKLLFTNTHILQNTHVNIEFMSRRFIIIADKNQCYGEHVAPAKAKHGRCTDGQMTDKVIPTWHFALLAP